MSAMLHSTLNNLKNQVDVTVYFVTNAPESNILDLQGKINALPEVATSTYTSADQALANFTNRHAGDTETIAALGELSENPLGAELDIKAKDPSQYESIAQYLQNGSFLLNDGTSMIYKVNYAQNATAISSLNKIINSSNTIGLAVIIFFAIASVLITFNTIGLTIYLARDEISVMKLVGASNAYIRGPFMVEGLICGTFSTALALILLYPVAYWLGPISENLGTGVNLFNYYLYNLFFILLVLLASGLILGALSSYLAVKRYLKV